MTPENEARHEQDRTTDFAARPQRAPARPSRSAGRRPGLPVEARTPTSAISRTSRALRHLDRRRVGPEAAARGVDQSRSTIPSRTATRRAWSATSMIVNHERNMTAIGRKAEQLPAARRALSDELGRDADATPNSPPSWASTAGLPAQVEEPKQAGYDNGGFKHLRRLDNRASRSSIRYPQDRRHRRAPLRHGRATTPTSRPRWRATSATSW